MIVKETFAFWYTCELNQNIREKVESSDPATLINYLKAIKLFYEISDISINWKKSKILVFLELPQLLLIIKHNN
ncbi:MAG: hypothetical protein ACRD8K_08200, partial [Nitrososphaeraceae archaeon]